MTKVSSIAFFYQDRKILHQQARSLKILRKLYFAEKRLSPTKPNKNNFLLEKLSLSLRKIITTNSELMKELMKHIPAIKNFIEERTQALQEISDNMVKKFLTDAYKLPFLFPVRIIVSEEKFVNFLFDMRKDLFEGKKIDIATQQADKKADIEPELPEVKEEVKAKEETESITAKTAKAKNSTKVVKKTTESVGTKVAKSPTNSQTNKTSKAKKEKILA